MFLFIFIFNNIRLLFLLQDQNNDLLKIVCGYHSLPLPPRGTEMIFQPLDHLQPIKYRRPRVSELELYGSCANVERYGSSLELAEVRPLVLHVVVVYFFSFFEPILSERHWLR